MNILKPTTIIEIVTILFVILFLYTGISKIIDYGVFKEQIATSPILAPIAPYIAGALPWVEFLAVILLTIPRWRLVGLKVSVILMTLFTIYIIAMMTFSKDLPCSCGGVIELLSWRAHIIFNSAFITLGLLGIIMQRRIKQVMRQTLRGIIQGELINSK